MRLSCNGPSVFNSHKQHILRVTRRLRRCAAKESSHGVCEDFGCSTRIIRRDSRDNMYEMD